MSLKLQTKPGKTSRSIKFLSQISTSTQSIKKLTKNDLLALMELTQPEIEYVVEKISDKSRTRIMKLLEDVNVIEDDFEMLLSRKVSMNTEFDEPGLDTEVKVSAKPPWIAQNLEIHKSFCSSLAKVSKNLSIIKAPKKRKRTSVKPCDSITSLLQKMMHGFGDFCPNSNQTTAEKIEYFLKTDWIPFLITKEPEKDQKPELDDEFAKKIYSREIQSYKKLKKIMKEVDGLKEKEAEYDISFIPKDEIGEDFEVDQDQPLEPNEESKEGEKDEDFDQEVKEEELLHEERTTFYSELVESMDETSYTVFNKCRTTNFLSRGKEVFLEWIGIQLPKNMIDIIAHIAYNEVRLIVEDSIRSLSAHKKLEKINESLTLNLVSDSIKKRMEIMENRITKYNLQKGEELFVKEYVKYQDYNEHFQSNCSKFITVKRSKKDNLVLIKIKKDKFWYPLTKTQEVQMKESRGQNLWKKEKSHFKEATEKWNQMEKAEQNDYALRRIGEKEVVAFLKIKNGKFVPKSPYACFIDEKVDHYTTSGKSKVKIDHKFFYIIFKLWQTMTDQQKQAYSQKVNK
ncbi:unnamed protein product [Moneuplotes crassus]|uniref:Uncharacterized protein n=1 Tax=Euplotes crassus TaxID=5936 RepID=A0AAD1U4B0_EUPCR|nr:unnamed protein product [Moneuplotes crassus]